MAEYVDTLREFIKEKAAEIEERFILRMDQLEEQFINVQKEQNVKNENLATEIKTINSELHSLKSKLKKFKTTLTKVHGNNELIAKMTEEKYDKFYQNLFDNNNRIKRVSEQMDNFRSEIKTIVDKVHSDVDDLTANIDKLMEDLLTNIGNKIENQKIEMEQILNESSSTKRFDEKTTSFEDEMNAIKIQLETIMEENQVSPNNIQFIRGLAMSDDILKYHLTTYTWKVSGIEDMMKKKTFEYDSETFPLNGYPFSAKLKLELKDDDDDEPCIKLAYIDENRQGKPLPIKLIPRVTFILRDLSGQGSNRIRTSSVPFSGSQNFNSYSYNRPLCSKSHLTQKSSVYNQNDSIVIDVLVEPPSVTTSFVSNDGILTWKVNNYYRKKKAIGDRLMFYDPSPYFYTSPNGYRVQVLIHLNWTGNYRGRGLTVEIIFMTGEYDATLSRSFPHKTTFILFNQLDPTKHMKQTVEKDVGNRCQYVIDMASHDDIDNSGFITNDCMYYKVVIEQKK